MSALLGWALDAFRIFHRYIPRNGRWIQKCQASASRDTAPTHREPKDPSAKGICDTCNGAMPRNKGARR